MRTPRKLNVQFMIKKNTYRHHNISQHIILYFYILPLETHWDFEKRIRNSNLLLDEAIKIDMKKEIENSFSKSEVALLSPKPILTYCTRALRRLLRH